MAGSKNDVVVGKNADFSQAGAPNSLTSESNGLVADGNMWIGSTALNAGNTHINVGTITSPLGTLSVGYSSPNITLDLAGGSTGIDSIGVQGSSPPGTNPVVPTVAGQVDFEGSIVAAGTSPLIAASVAANTVVYQIQLTQAIASADNTKVGLANFDSTSFAVSNGFVTLAGGGGFTWNDVSGAFSPLKNNGYFVTGTATGTLPASPSQGDTIKFFVDTTQILTIQASGSQIIRFGSAVTAAGGTAVSTARGDSVELTYRSSDVCWCAIGGVQGTWTLT